MVLPNLKKSDRQPPAEKRRASKKKVAPGGGLKTALSLLKSISPVPARLTLRASRLYYNCGSMLCSDGSVLTKSGLARPEYFI